MKMQFWFLSDFDRSIFLSPSGKTVGKYIYIYIKLMLSF